MWCSFETNGVTVESVQRVWVVGNSGSGKSTVAAALAYRLRVLHLELDAINHQPDWVPLDVDEFRDRVSAVVDTGAWVVDGNYRSVSDLVWARADTVVWLDLTRPVVMRQLVRRTARRVVRREELWNGNRERLRNFVSHDPLQSVLMWAWTNHDEYAARYTELERQARELGTTFVRLGSRDEVRAFLARPVR